MTRNLLCLAALVLVLTAILSLGLPSPALAHGQFCSYQGQGCKSCTLSNGSRGYRSCEIQRCLADGQWHNHLINCGNCATACPI